ncbi:hypothetical protein FYJ68_06645 [Olsenella sp. CA-Schmier-601-WT-1]|uniref:Uncharacterized protein n=1 Tax=Olsenella porci TaxID=2652279 RepID=A0A6N7XB54_9ACTN|nr:hypothetical protein [Olsenella porci]
MFPYYFVNVLGGENAQEVCREAASLAQRRAEPEPWLRGNARPGNRGDAGRPGGAGGPAGRGHPGGAG